MGKTWTTDAIFRETRSNMERSKAEGCINAEMECADAQAVCDYLGVEFYPFFLNGNLLDSAVWGGRIMGSETETAFQLRSFSLALKLAFALGSAT